MKFYLKTFLHRGMLFGGFGPIVAAIVYLILSYTVPGFSLSGGEVFMAVISTYLLAFVHAGASIFNQIEHWPIAKSMLFHFGALYLVYSLCYLLNGWIPFDAAVFLIFTAVFIGAYLVIWLSVFLAAKATGKRLNATLKP